MSGALDLSRCGPLHQAEAAVVAALKQAFDPRYFGHAIVPPRLGPDGWTKLTRKLPFVGLGWHGWRPVSGCGAQFQGVAGFTVFLITQAATIERAQDGDRLGVGLFGLLQLAIAHLHGLEIPGVGTLLVADAQPAVDEGWTDASKVMALLTLTINTGLLEDGAQAEALETLRTLGTDWSAVLPELRDEIVLETGP